MKGKRPGKSLDDLCTIMKDTAGVIIDPSYILGDTPESLENKEKSDQSLLNSKTQRPKFKFNY